MTNEIMTTNVELKNAKLRNFTKQIFSQGLNIRKAYARIAVTLAKIEVADCLETDGFKNVADYAKQVLGINKSQSNAMLRIGREWIDAKTLESNVTHEEGNDYGTTQLQALLPLKSVEKANELVEHGIINPNMTVKEIKDAVKNVINPKNGESEESTAHSEGEEVIEAVAVETGRYNVEKVVEFVTDEHGNHMFMVNNEIFSARDVLALINEWVPYTASAIEENLR